MDIEKLYQDVWAQVFADRWVNHNSRPNPLSPHYFMARDDADEAAKAAVEAWDPAKAHAVIAAKAKQS